MQAPFEQVPAPLVKEHTLPIRPLEMTEVVSNDSGLMHVAAALDRPLVALYGPSSPDFTPPLSHKARVIRLISGYHKVRKGDAAEGYHQSLIDITPQRVLEELNDLLLEKTEQEED